MIYVWNLHIYLLVGLFDQSFPLVDTLSTTVSYTYAFNNVPDPAPHIAIQLLFPNYSSILADKLQSGRFSNKFANSTAAYKVDVARHAAAKQYFGITTVPTVVLFKGGKEIRRVEGGNEEQMAEVVKTLSS